MEKFGAGFDAYCADVNRWWPRLQGLGATLSSMEFNWKRWILKEHTTQYIWLAGIFLLLFAPIPVWRYPAIAVMMNCGVINYWEFVLLP